MERMKIESSTKIRNINYSYKPKNRNIKARDRSVLTYEKEILTGETNISEENRAHNYLNFMKMSHMTILMKKE
jgi:hypothetical protein